MASTNTAIVKWNEVGTALILYTEKQDEKTLGECMEVMFSAIKFVAPYAGTVASFVKPMVIPDPVMIELNKINKKLSDLDKKLDKIVSEIKEEFKLSEYNMYLNKLHNMQNLYTRFIQMPNKVTLDALNEQGKKNEMFDFINWLHREVTGQSLNPIIDFMKTDDDFPKFIKWTQLILAHYAQAMLLHGISVQLQPKVTKKILEQTLENDTALFAKNLREMQDVFTKFIEHLKQSYFSKLEERVISKVKTLPNLDDQGLANVMYDYVSDKYPFREWFVCVVSPHIHGGWYDFDHKQAIYLIESEKDGNRLAMNLKAFREIYHAPGWAKFSYKNPRVLFITSTIPNNSKYKDDVKNYLANIKEDTYCKYDGWGEGSRDLERKTARVVEEGLSKQYSSQILCQILTDKYKYSYKYSDQALICFQNRPIKSLFGLVSFDVKIITIKQD